MEGEKKFQKESFIGLSDYIDKVHEKIMERAGNQSPDPEFSDVNEWMMEKTADLGDELTQKYGAAALMQIPEWHRLIGSTFDPESGTLADTDEVYQSVKSRIFEFLEEIGSKI